MTVSINTRTWVDASEVASSQTVNKLQATGPTQLVTDHYLLDQQQLTSCIGEMVWVVFHPHHIGPANDTKLGVHILPMAFPWT